MSDETKHEIGLEEFLANQSIVHLLASIASIDDDDENIKVTPWIKPFGCVCSSAFVVPKASVKSVTPTKITAKCCSGDDLTVVDLVFQDSPKISSDLLNTFVKQLVGLTKKLKQTAATPRTPLPPLCVCASNCAPQCNPGDPQEYTRCNCVNSITNQPCGNPSYYDYPTGEMACPSGGDDDNGDHDSDSDGDSEIVGPAFRSRPHGLRRKR